MSLETWLHRPETGVVENLEWMTEVFQSLVGEQRLALRRAPRQSFEYTHYFDAQELSRARRFVRQNAHTEIWLPIWTEAVELTYSPDVADTTLAVDHSVADYRVDDFVLLWESEERYTIRVITDLTESTIVLDAPVAHQLYFPAVAPMRRALMREGMTVSRGGTLSEATVKFDIVDNADLAGLYGIGNTAIYIAMDGSGSMDTVTANGQTRRANLKTAVTGLLAHLRDNPGEIPNDIMTVNWGTSAVTALRRDADSTGYDELITWVNATGGAGGTDFTAGVSALSSFFSGAGSKRRVMIFLTDGEPTASTVAPAAATVNSISDLSSFCFNIDLVNTVYTAQLDNTPSDGVPVISGGDPTALLTAISNVITDGNVYDTYDGLQVMSDRPVLHDSVEESMVRAAEYVDSGYGPIGVERVRAYTDYGQTAAFMDLRGEELWTRRTWLHSLRGRQRAFWMPSFNMDLELLETVEASATVLPVRRIATSNGYYVDRHVAFLMKDGQRHYRQIVSAAQVPDTMQDTITLSSSLGFELDPDEIESLCFLSKVRLNTDLVTMNHELQEHTLTTIALMEVPE